MDLQQLERALRENGGDFNLDSVIRSLNELQIEPATQGPPTPATAPNVAEENLPRNGAEWAEVIVREVLSASDVNDGISRVSRMVEALEKCVHARATSGMANSIAKLMQAITVLLQAMTILYDRHRARIAELERLLSQHEDQMDVRKS